MPTEEKPPISSGTKMAEETRAACNHLSDEERQALLDRAMQIIYQDGNDKRPVANRR